MTIGSIVSASGGLFGPKNSHKEKYPIVTHVLLEDSNHRLQEVMFSRRGDRRYCIAGLTTAGNPNTSLSELARHVALNRLSKQITFEVPEKWLSMICGGRFEEPGTYEIRSLTPREKRDFESCLYNNSM